MSIDSHVFMFLWHPLFLCLSLCVGLELAGTLLPEVTVILVRFRQVLALTPIVVKTLRRKGKLSLVVRKTAFGVSDLVGHTPGCAVIEDG